MPRSLPLSTQLLNSLVLFWFSSRPLRLFVIAHHSAWHKTHNCSQPAITVTGKQRLRTENRLLRQRIENLEQESAELADKLIQGQVSSKCAARARQCVSGLG